MDGRLLAGLGVGAVVGLGLVARSQLVQQRCPECGESHSIAGSRAKDPESAISEALYERRYTEPSLFVLDRDYVESYVKPRWTALKKARQALIDHPERLSPEAHRYGVVKAMYAEQRASRKSRSEWKNQISYAADWQTKQELAAEFAPPEDALLVPCGPKQGTLEMRLAPKSHDLRLVLEPTNNTGEPRLAIFDLRTGQRVVLFGLDKARSPFWPTGLESANLFSATSKMSAPSMSLPAGRTGEGGTCSAEGFTGDNADPIRTNICSACYALKGHYGYLSNVVPGIVRKAFIRQELEADKSGHRLGEALATAITAFATTGTGDAWSKRRTLELGIWSGAKLTAPRRVRGQLDRDAIPPTALDAETAAALGAPAAGTTTDTLRRTSKVPRGAVAGFFRIHDSGDFSVPSGQAGYVAAWAHAATLLPHVQFWAPTRIWILGARNEAMLASAVATAPDNLAIRPSAITVDDPAPDVRGLAAGTTVNSHSRGQYVQTTDQHGVPTWQCPVYSRTIVGASGELREAKSCAEAGCRVCWMATGVPVAYGKH
jgi:hypothetical protein